MNRLWWGLFGVAILASQTGCRNSCGERRFHLFSRPQCETANGKLTSAPRDAAACPPGALASFPGYPPAGNVAGPTIYDGGVPMVPGPGYSNPPTGADPATIPPTYLPAVPVPAIPSAKNVLPPPKELIPPTGVTGYAK